MLKTLTSRACVRTQLPVMRRPALCVTSQIRHHSINDKYTNKYADKLLAKAEKQGLSVEELLKRAEPEKIRAAEVADLKQQAQQFRRQYSRKSEVAASEVPKTKPVTMELNSFIDVEKFGAHSKAEIEMLWKARFLNTPNSFSGAMSAEAFAKLYVNARKFPTFVLPLPHGSEGVELHYVQWSFVTSQTVYCLITSLAQYKLHKEYAHPHTTFMLHTDFVADKEVALTNTVVQDNEVSMENAALLVLNLQRFYTADAQSPHGQAKADLVRQFNTGSTDFSVDKLIEATETLD